MKNKSTTLLIAVLAVIAGVLGYNYFKQPLLKRFQQQQTETDVAQEEKTPEISFSANQKISQLMAYPLVVEDQLQPTAASTVSAQITSTASSIPVDQQAWDELRAFNPGIVTIFGGNISTSSARLVSDQLKTAFAQSEFRPLLAVDHEGGTVPRLSGEGFSQLPAFREMCQADQGEVEEAFTESARELSQIGVHIVFAPMVDLAANHPVFGSRVCSDHEQASRTAEFFIRAFAQYSIMPVLKHFPGIGNAARDLHNYPQTIQIDPLDANIFRDLLDKYPNIGIMTSHVRLQDKLNGKPCSLSEQCLEPLGKFYPEATVFADALDMESAQISEAQLKSGSATDSAELSATESAQPVAETQASSEDQDLDQLALRAEQALRAGNHFLVFGRSVSAQQLAAVRDRLVELYHSDSGFKSVVDQRFQRVLDLKAADDN